MATADPPPGGSGPPSGPPGAPAGPPTSSPATQAGPPASDPHAVSASGPSYSAKVMVNVNRNQRLKRNVLEISLDVDLGVKLKLEATDVARTLVKLGIDIQSQVEGFQVCPGNSRKIFVWFKNDLDILRFCKDESYKVTEGIKTGLIKPMDKAEVTVLIKGLNFNTPDTLVKEYLNKHGKLVSERVIYEVESEGPFKGVKNGNRKYLVDFTKGVNAGSYHILDGSNVQVNYPGQHKTCGRCHQTSRSCPGGAIARECENKNGRKVKLIDHMKAHWNIIGFAPSSFKLDLGDDEEVHQQTADAPIKTDTHFTPTHKPLSTDPNGANMIGVVLKNLPEGMPEEDIIGFLKTKGLKGENAVVKIHHNKKMVPARI